MYAKQHSKIKISLVLLLSLLCGACYQELMVPELLLQGSMERVIGFDGIYAFSDMSDGLLLYCLGTDTLSEFTPRVQFEKYQTLCLDGRQLKNGVTNPMGQVIINHPYQVVGQHEEGTDTFNLFFTLFPIAHLQTGQPIRNEPKVLSWMALQYNDPAGQQHSTRLFESFAGIEIRGQSTSNYDKKQYGLELWADQRETDLSASLLGMRYGEDWILDAMWTDDLRMRNKLSFEVWEKMASLPEEDRRSDVYPGIHLEYVELFINNRYEGIYCLGERFNERILGYAPNQYEQGGVLYEAIDKAEGSTRFEVYHSEPGNSLVWDGWEMIYPGHELYWHPLAELRKTVVLKSEEEFSSSIESMIYLDNMADHYIFINLLLAYDNIGKNNFYARYSTASRFFIIPWDLDYTWGKRWEMLDSGPGGMAYNAFHRRLLESDDLDFYELVSERWNTYRNSIFRLDSLLANVDRHYNALKNSGVIERENKRWPDADIDLEYEYAYICNWIEQRLLILDEHLNEELD